MRNDIASRPNSPVKRVDPDTQEQLVFDTTVDWDSTPGLERIGPLSQHMESGIDVSTLTKLITDGHLRESHTQGGGPTMGTLAEFGRQADEEFDRATVRYTGYMIDPDRKDREPDTRTTLTAIILTAQNDNHVPQPLRDRFRHEFGKADEFELQYELCRAWWD